MSNENTRDNVTIKSNANGTFEVATPNSTRMASIKQDGGATIVDFTQAGPDDNIPFKSDLQGVMESAGGSIELSDGRIKALQPQTYNAPIRTADPSMLLSSLVDHSGRPCSDMRKAAANPQDYRVTVKGTQVSLEVAQRLGWVSTEGSGNLAVNHDNLVHDVAPAPQQSPKADTFHVSDITLDLTAGRLRGELGVADPIGLAIKYLENGLSACKQVADAAGGQASVQGISDILKNALDSFMLSAGNQIESAGMVGKGQGQAVIDNMVNGMDLKVFQRVLAGMLRGDRASFKEAVRRFKTGDRY